MQILKHILPKWQYIIILMMLCVFTRGLHYGSLDSLLPELFRKLFLTAEKQPLFLHPAFFFLVHKAPVTNYPTGRSLEKPKKEHLFLSFLQQPSGLQYLTHLTKKFFKIPPRESYISFSLIPYDLHKRNKNKKFPAQRNNPRSDASFKRIP